MSETTIRVVDDDYVDAPARVRGALAAGDAPEPGDPPPAPAGP